MNVFIGNEEILDRSKEEAEEYCGELEKLNSEEGYFEELVVAVNHEELGDRWVKKAARNLYKLYDATGRFGKMKAVADVHLGPEEKSRAEGKWIEWLEEKAPDLAEAEIEGYP